MMMNTIFKNFKNVVVYDYEFKAISGNPPEPVCVVYKELHSDKIIKQWLVGGGSTCPFPVHETLFIAHYCNAEVSCDIALGYEKPRYIWDTFVEEKKLLNGKLKQGYGLVDTALRYGITGVMDKNKKDYWRDTVINNYPNYSDEDKTGIIDYCLEDVLLTEKLFLKQSAALEKLDSNFKRVLQQALFHGRSMAITAQIEANGIPLNNDLYNDLDKYYDDVRRQEIDELQKVFDVYELGKFNHKKFEAALAKENLLNRWPKSAAGRLKTDDRTIYRFQEVNEKIMQFRNSKFIIESRTLKGFNVGKDGRSRAPLNLFGQITGRTNVSTAINPFGAPRRMRTIIGTDKEHILVYADWKSQEAVIQAYLSQDQEMIKAISSGDIYLHTAKKVGAVPAAAKRKDYEKERELYKQSFLAIGYGQTAYGLKDKLGISLPKATFIHAQIIKTYNVFQEWTKQITAKAMQRGYFLTKYGWKYWLSDREVQNPRRLLNWPIQSHGSEILRRAMIDLDEEGFEISMIVHDAVLIHMKRKGCAARLRKLKSIMSAAAAKVILSPIPVDLKIIRASFTQDGEHKERWNALYQKLVNAKRGVKKNDS
jgi:DNA polymerase I-like protein with 3'-5' exonuclease and polymerase domains